MGMNLVVLTGRLTADPELKYTQSGKAFARFSLAVNRSYNREETDFINCVAWDKKAELAAEYLRKGNQAGVQGSIRVRAYDDESGQKKRITEVLVENIEFLESRKSEGGSSYSKDNGSSSKASSANVSNNNNSSNNDNDEDDFPF